MKAFKIFLSFYIPLVAMLLSYSIYIAIDKSVSSYKKSIINDYSIVVIAKKDIKANMIKDLGINISKLVPLEHSKVIEKFKDSLSKKSLKLLEKKLPSFYKLYLNDFPSKLELTNIKIKLLSSKLILKVETFSKNHDKISSILSITQQIIYILFSIVVMFSILLLAKHIKIWFYENNERISIMKLHGASNIYCAIPIIKISLLSAGLASITVILLSYYILATTNFIIPISFDLNFFKVIALSFIISISTITIVLFKHKFND